MSNEKMREEFEAWRAKHTGVSVSRVEGMRDVDGYTYGTLNSEYRAWQASRAALCVELPSKTNDESDERSIWYDHAINEAQDALDASGVRYK